MDNEESKGEYEIDLIEDLRFTEDYTPEIEFKVRWKGFASEDSTWEAFKDLSKNAGNSIETYIGKLLSEKSKTIQKKKFEKEIR